MVMTMTEYETAVIRDLRAKNPILKRINGSGMRCKSERDQFKKMLADLRPETFTQFVDQVRIFCGRLDRRYTVNGYPLRYNLQFENVIIVEDGMSF